MMQHPFDRSPGLANPNLQVGKVWFGPRYTCTCGYYFKGEPCTCYGQGSISIPNVPVPYPLPESLREEIRQLTETTNDTEVTTYVQDETEPAIVLTVDEALDVFEFLTALSDQTMLDQYFGGAVERLSLRMMRDRLDAVLEALEHQLEAAEAEDQ